MDHPTNETNAKQPDEAEMRLAMELLFYAYREFTAGPDTILAQWGFGRAHHRVIYFVGRHPGITVSGLLNILRITKQSLSRVLGQLVSEGLIEQNSDTADRRRRRLTLTGRGADLDRRLRDTQSRLIARAYHEAGAVGVKGFTDVLLGLINEKDRRRFMASEKDSWEKHDSPTAITEI